VPTEKHCDHWNKRFIPVQAISIVILL